jgi:glycerol-3-phosphate dehydrogenase (NAD+)
MADILASSTEVAEGVDTSMALVNLIKTRCKGYRLDLNTLLCFGVASILEGNLTPAEGKES